MIELKKDELYKIVPLCKEKDQIEALKRIEGNMGMVFVEDIDSPTYAKLILADFCYLIGYPRNEAVAKEIIIQLQEDCKNKIIDFTNQKWGELIEEIYKDNYKKFYRYKMKGSKEAFDIKKLSIYANSIPPNYEMKKIDEVRYHKVFEKGWTLDLCSNFSSAEDFLLNGIGYVILFNGEIVSGASSYSCTKDSIDITIGTQEGHRRKGLALACASKLILSCLELDIYPSWEAANKISVALAEKLGYCFDKEYLVYMIV